MNRLEQFLKETPRIPLLPAATPLTRLPRLETMWNHEGIFIKRDDLTGIGLGGNKIRCLEYILGEAREAGCSRILVDGPGQSNLCMLTAATCAKLGLECEIFHDCQEPESYQGNLLLNRLLGVTTHFLGDISEAQRTAYMERRCLLYGDEGIKSFAIKNGATTGRGALGYTAAVPEMMKQCKEQGIEGMTVFAPGGHGGVAAGLIYGNALMGMPFHIVVISVEDDKETLTAHIEKTIHETEAISGIEMDQQLGQVCEIVEDFRGGGWGVNTPESEAQVLEFARAEGVFVENVYTSKVLVGMKRWILDQKAAGTVCYLHTGGTGSLFAQY